MKLQLLEKEKLILVWKLKSEKDSVIPEEIQCQINKYKEKKFKLIIMYSGNSDLSEDMNELVSRNYKQIMSNSIGNIAQKRVSSF